MAQNAMEAPNQMAQSLEMVHEFGAGEMPEEDNEGFATAQTGTYFVLIKLLCDMYLICILTYHMDEMLNATKLIQLYMFIFSSWFVFFLSIGIDDHSAWEMLDTYGTEGKVSTVYIRFTAYHTCISSNFTECDWVF